MATQESIEAEAADSFTLQEYFTPKRERKRLGRFPHLVAVSLSIVWQSAPGVLLSVIAIETVVAASTAGELLLVKGLLDHLVGGHSTGRHVHFSAVLPDIVALSVLTLVINLFSSIMSLRSRLLSQLVARHAINGVIRTAISVDLVTYEAPGYHDKLQRARMAALYRPAMMVQELIGAAGAVLSIIGIGAALLVISPLFCLLIAVAYIPVWFVTRRAGQIAYEQTVEQTELERMRQYLFELLTSKAGAQEIRAFGIGTFLADRQDSIYARLLREIAALMRKRMKLALAGQIATGLLSGGALAVLVWFVTSGRLGLAAAGTAATAMVLLSGRLHGVAGSSGGLYENSLYLEDYVNFVAAQSGIAASRPTTPLARPPEEVRADRLSFTYPSRQAPSLIDASLVLRRGEVVALVGENGSGKTTFAKLLAGLYTPDEGTVRWDGVDITTLDPADLRRHVAVIFQDFVRYLLAAHDNIALGDERRFGDRAAVARAAQAAGIADTLASLRGGYDTILGPAYYGGSDLSGGQWQRIALARLFFRDAPVVILDEPTASLDPRAEVELYRSMRSLFDGRGVLLITHRFASARTADRIYVLRDGRICEQGTHEELIALDGYYAELFALQASQFQS